MITAPVPLSPPLPRRPAPDESISLCILPDGSGAVKLRVRVSRQAAARLPATPPPATTVAPSALAPVRLEAADQVAPPALQALQPALMPPPPAVGRKPRDSAAAQQPTAIIANGAAAGCRALAAAASAPSPPAPVADVQAPPALPPLAVPVAPACSQGAGDGTESSEYAEEDEASWRSALAALLPPAPASLVRRDVAA